jgi:alkylation response protein AidB-like acyl-CoA dehydrogenase
VTGLAGSGSGDMEVHDIRVPEAFSYSLVAGKPFETGPLYAFPPFGLLAMGIAAVALGNARAAIDDLVDLAGAKKPQGSKRTLAERAAAQSELAQAEATLRSARAFYYEAIGDAFRKAQTGDPISIEDRALLRWQPPTPRAAAPTWCNMYELGGAPGVLGPSLAAFSRSRGHPTH